MQIITMAIDWKSTIFGALGGLGLFLFGMELLGDSLKKLAGSKLKLILEKTTNTPIKGILVGIVVTGLIQSSSATTVLVIGLVRAGLMTFPQAIGVIFGANIGTTITSVLIGLDIGEYALPIMFLGAALIFFIPKKKIKELGKVILGFGMLFFGLETMGTPLKSLISLPEVQALFQSVSEFPILGVATGVGVTSVIQSSSATIGLLQEMFSTGNVPLVGAIAIVFGCNIGTTVTALIASAGAPVAAKRAAAIHTMFNFIGTFLFMLILRPYSQLVAWLAETIYGAGWETNRMTISIAHVLFNFTTVFVLYWFIKQMTWVVTKLVPSKNEVQIDEVILDQKLIQQSPVLALENARNAIINMGNVVKAMFEFVYDYSLQRNDKTFDMGMQCEEVIDTMDDKIHNYLVKIGATDLDEPQIQLLAKDIDTISDLERVGDHLTNLLEFFQERYDNNIPLHPESKAELEEMFDLLRKSLTEAVYAFEKQDKKIASEVNDREEVIDRLTKKFRKNHIARIQDQSCSENESGYYVDILSNMERIGDHCDNIVVNVLSEFYTHDDKFSTQ
ncbi:MAG TPA: Na/Pi cotransporter family protein [Candidatus Izemoplasmatales bacterium]|nr:Na/Pi cotransporter family protein [Bacillota bacterium]HRY77457.1 Na/Pi cotransporter family protein [Candidatus Izemoplasmatales bacterium]